MGLFLKMGMNRKVLQLWAVVYLFVQCESQTNLSRGPPLFEGAPNLLDSFIPASMQIMAHLTELMKYEIKPPKPGPTTTTTTTMRPTRPHKPAIYAPVVPPGPEVYFAKGMSYEEYVKRLQNPSGYNYFERYVFAIEDDESEDPAVVGRSIGSYDASYAPKDYNLYFGNAVTDVFRLANSIEVDFNPRDVDRQVQEFSQKFDDSNFRFELLRKKRVPPTKAYVTLLSLYDLLNKESKRIGLSKYQGYSDNVLKQLAEASTGTSAFQLRTVLSKVVERQDTKKAEILRKLGTLIKDLDDDKSYMNLALRHIPPLPFAL